MKVRFTSGPKAGTIEHLPPHICQPLIAAGLCEHLPHKDFRERLAEEASPAATPPVVEWGVLDKGLSRFSIVRVVKRVGAETYYYDAPPDDAPASIKQKFSALTQPQPSPESVHEARVQERYRQIEREKKERASVMSTLFGGMWLGWWVFR